MNAREFDQWYADYCAAFPDVPAFVNQNNPKETLIHWSNVLAPCELSDAKHATKLMLRGDEEPVKAFERSLTPQKVAAICAKLLAGRKAECIPMVDLGKQYRVRCTTCQDTGLVSCWHPDSMELAVRGELKPGSQGQYFVAVRCPCVAGNRYESLSLGGLNKSKTNGGGQFNRSTPLIYDERQWCKVEGGENSEARIASLVEFMANYQPSNFDQALADF